MLLLQFLESIEHLVAAITLTSMNPFVSGQRVSATNLTNSLQIGLVDRAFAMFCIDLSRILDSASSIASLDRDRQIQGTSIFWLLPSRRKLGHGKLALT